MRILLKTTNNIQPVPFDYQSKMVGTIHKWIGKENRLHDDISLYSFSWLQGATFVNNSLDFANGATFFISTFDNSIAYNIIGTIREEPEMFCGLKVQEITICPNPQFIDKELFRCASPIFIKRKLPNGNIKHYSFDDPISGQLMKETLVTKMKIAGMEDDPTLDIRFDLSYPKKKTKLMRYHGIGNKANLCPVLISGKPTTKEFAWNVGLGNCTGIGFGAIY